MLTGSSQNGMWHSTGAVDSPVVDNQSHRRRESDLTHPVIQDEHGKPVVLPYPTGRQPQGVPKGRRVKEEGASECRSVMERIGIAPHRRWATSSHAKAGRLPSGLHSRESLSNRLRRQSR